jgi:hypothetical protein
MSFRTRTVPVFATTIAAALALGTGPAWGCPACAANGVGSSATWYAVAGLVGAPFVIGAIAFVVLRGLMEDRRS